MAESRYGAILILVGGLQTILVSVIAVGSMISPLPEATWFITTIQSVPYWMALAWSGLLLLRLGFLLRADHLRFGTQISGFNRSRLVFEAYTAPLLGILGVFTTVVTVSLYLFG